MVEYPNKVWSWGDGGFNGYLVDKNYFTNTGSSGSTTTNMNNSNNSDIFDMFLHVQESTSAPCYSCLGSEEFTYNSDTITLDPGESFIIAYTQQLTHGHHHTINLGYNLMHIDGSVIYEDGSNEAVSNNFKIYGDRQLTAYSGTTTYIPSNRLAGNSNTGSGEGYLRYKNNTDSSQEVYINVDAIVIWNTPQQGQPQQGPWTTTFTFFLQRIQ